MIKTILHIGSPKAGSTFLQAYFHEHPSIHFSHDDFGEFNRHGRLDETLQAINPIDAINLFSSEKLTCPSFFVNFQNGGFNKENDIKKYQEETAKQLAEWSPDATVLFIVRGFRTVLPSLYAQHVASGGVETYDVFLDSYQKEVAQIFNYDFIYQTYEKYFDKDKILVVPFELLKTDKDAFLQLIEKEFEIPHHAFISKEVNKSLSPKHIDFYLKCSKFIYRVIRVFPKFMRRRMTNFYILVLESGIMIKIKDTFFSKKGKTHHSSETQAKEEAVLQIMKSNAEELVQLEHVSSFSEHYS